MHTLKILAAILIFSAGSHRPARAQEILTWGDCLKEAHKNNPDLISAEEDINIQKAGKDITASTLYPQISANAAGSTSKTSTTGSSGITTSATSDSYTYGVSGSQLIFDGSKSFQEVKAASQDIEAARQAYRFTSSGVRLNLRGAFVALLKAQELTAVAEDIVKIRRNSLILITLRYQSGLEHKGALLTAEANLAEAHFELSQAGRNAEFAQRQVVKEMGRKEFRPVAVQGNFTVSETARDKPDFEGLVKNNPSLLEAVARKNSALFGLKSAYGDFYPEISASAGAEKKSARWPPENDQWNLGLSVTIPLFEGGLQFAQVSQAKARYRQLEADEMSVRNTAIVNLAQVWAGLQDAIETVEVRRKSLEAAKERSKIAEARYAAGFISFDDWIIIENALVTAKKSYLDAQANALLLEAGWIQAKGETLEYAQ